jgi:hypothetical protein
MSTHARISPSSRHRWALCPGSVREEAKYPEQPSGPAAIDGTHSHTLLEYCIRDKLLDPLTTVGMTMGDHEGNFTVAQDRAERVKVAIDYIRQRVEHLQAEGSEVAVYAEEKVNPVSLVGRDDMGGTIDCRIVTLNLIEIIDYKDGMNSVPVEGNLQLEQYAYGALAEYPPGTQMPSRVQMTIIQPKIMLKGLPAISSHMVRSIDLFKQLDTLKAEAAATDSPDAPLVPGDSQCKYCRAKGSCSALASHVMEKAGVMFPVVQTELPAVLDLAEQSAGKDPTVMDVGQLQLILEAAPLLRQLLESVEEEALRRMKMGTQIPGFKVVNGRGSRSWNLDEDQMEKKLIQLGIPKGEVYTRKLVSPAQVEKLRWAKRDGTKVQLSPKQIERMDKEYVAHMTGKPTVVPESDSRKAITLTADNLFKPVENVPGFITESVEFIADPLPSWLSLN